MAEADLYNMSDVFLSYSRRDSEFVHRLFDDIKASGKEVWADFEDIPKAAEWWEEIKAGIDAADTFVFIISPDSVNSDVCRQEIEHALASNKRFLPILYREIIEDADKAKVHPAISSHNWIFLRQQDDYEAAFNVLMESIETDLDHNRTLTRLLVHAKEWHDNNRGKSYLLLGDDLKQADDWLSHAMNKTPAPTNLHAEYIKASREAETGRQRRLFTLAVTGMIVALFLAVFAVYQMLDARQARDAAEDARQQAEQSERQARALALSASASEALANNNPDLALVLAQAAVAIDSQNPIIATSLADAAYAPGTAQRITITNVLTTAVYAPDASLFAAGFDSGDLCLYDGSTYQEIACLMSDGAKAHADYVLWIHMNASGTRLLSSGADDRLLVWDIEPDSATYGTILLEIVVPNLRASSLASDGNFAVVGTSDGRFGYWDLASSEIRYLDYQHDAAINVIALNSDNSRALAGTANGIMLEYSISELALIDDYMNSNNRASISAVAYNPTSTIAVSGDVSASLTAWDLETGSIIRTYQGHDENVTAISFAENGRTMFTASWDNSIREWDVASGRIVQAFYGHNGGLNALSLTADNLAMVSGGFDGSIRIWHVHPTIFERQLLSSDESLYAADWNDRHIVAANEAGEIFIYNRNSGELLRELANDNIEAEVFYAEIRADGNHFAVVYSNCLVRLFDMRGERIWSQPIQDDTFCRQLGFRPNVDELLVMSGTAFYRLDARTGEMIGAIPYVPELSPNFRSFAFTVDGNQLLIGNNSRTQNLRLIDMSTGELIRDFVGHTDGVLAIDLSDDGTQVVSGSFDNDVRVWNFSDGELIWLLEGHSDRVTDVDFNPQGDSVVSSSNDTTMRLWDLSTGVTRYTYRGHTERLVLAIFSEDGRRILTTSHDSTMIIWRFPQRLEELQTWIMENRYLRELSCRERNVYLFETNDCG